MANFISRFFNQEVRTEDWFEALSPQDRIDVTAVGRWLQETAGEGSGVLAVGGTVRAVRRGSKKGRVNRVQRRPDVDIKVCVGKGKSSRVVRGKIAERLRVDPPNGYALEILERVDHGTGIPYYTFVAQSRGGRRIHAFPPRPGDPPLIEEVKERRFIGGAFCRLRF